MLLDLLPLEQPAKAKAAGTSGGGHGGNTFAVAHTAAPHRPRRPAPLERHTGSAHGLTHTSGHANGVPHLRGHLKGIIISAGGADGYPVIEGEAAGTTIHTGHAHGYAPARRQEDELILLGAI